MKAASHMQIYQDGDDGFRDFNFEEPSSIGNDLYVGVCFSLFHLLYFSYCVD